VSGTTSDDTVLGRLSGSFRDREGQLTIVLSLLIGVLVGLVVVCFILLTGRLAARMYPAGGAAWRRVLIPTIGALGTGFLLARYFPNARGSGIPQAKFALFINNGYISLRTVLDKFLCCSASLASGIELAEDRLALAEQLWQTRLASCGLSTSADEESLRLVMAKLAQ